MEFGLEGVELEEVSKLPWKRSPSYLGRGLQVTLEEVEVLEQPLEEVLGEVLGWKERVVVLGIAGRRLE